MNISAPLRVLTQTATSFDDIMRMVHVSNSVEDNFTPVPWHALFEDQYNELFNLTTVGARQVGKTTASVAVVVDAIRAKKPQTIVLVSHSRNMAEHVRRMIANTVSVNSLDRVIRNNKCFFETASGVEIIFACKSTFNTMTRGIKINLAIFDCDVDDLGILPHLCRVIEFRDTHHHTRQTTLAVSWLKSHYTKNISGYKLKDLKSTMVSTYGETLFKQYYELT